MSDINFAEGINVRKKTFRNGSFILKVGINMAEFYVDMSEYLPKTSYKQFFNN